MKAVPPYYKFKGLLS